MSESENFSPPEKCRDCPIQCTIGKKLLRISRVQELVTSDAESLVGESGEEFDEKIRTKLPEEIAEGVIVVTRTGIAKWLNDRDAEVTSLVEESESHSRSCDGALKCEPSKEGITYIVGLCTSRLPYILESEDSTHVDTHIRTTTKRPQ